MTIFLLSLDNSDTGIISSLEASIVGYLTSLQIGWNILTVAGFLIDLSFSHINRFYQNIIINISNQHSKALIRHEVI